MRSRQDLKAYPAHVLWLSLLCVLFCVKEDLGLITVMGIPSENSEPEQTSGPKGPLSLCIFWLSLSLSLSLYPNLLSLSLHPIPLFLFISLLSLSSLPHSSIYIYISLSTAEDKNPATAKNSGRTYLPDRAKCAFNKLQGNMGMNY